MRAKLAIAALLPLALLAACGGGDSGTADEDDARSASGEVLEGTISDSMLPLGETTSQPPLVAPPRATAAPSDAEDAEAAEGGEASEDAEAPEAAAPAPTPAASPAAPSE